MCVFVSVSLMVYDILNTLDTKLLFTLVLYRISNSCLLLCCIGYWCCFGRVRCCSQCRCVRPGIDSRKVSHMYQSYSVSSCAGLVFLIGRVLVVLH